MIKFIDYFYYQLLLSLIYQFIDYFIINYYQLYIIINNLFIGYFPLWLVLSGTSLRFIWKRLKKTDLWPPSAVSHYRALSLGIGSP